MLRAIAKRWLADRGYVLCRIHHGSPPTVASYIRKLAKRAPSPLYALCFDHAVSYQSELIATLGCDRVIFLAPCVPTAPHAKLQAPSVVRPAGRFLILADLEAGSIEHLLQKHDWLASAEAFLVRGSISTFCSGALDLALIDAQMRQVNFDLVDVLENVVAGSFAQASGLRPLLLYEPLPRRRPRRCGHGARQRIGEARAFLSTPIIRSGDLRPITARGDFGLHAAYNPGATIVDGESVLVFRTERHPWPLQRSSLPCFLGSAGAVIGSLSANGDLRNVRQLDVKVPAETGSHRLEDFRLFALGGEVYSNHSVITVPEPLRQNSPVRPEQLQTRVGISRLDRSGGRLLWCGFPELDRSTKQIEKNWAMFTDTAQLLLVYSMSPYVLLSCTNLETLRFTTLINERLHLTLETEEPPIRNSVNPVSYDDNHWLHIVHQVYPNKRYVYWAVLIHKRLLKPVKVSARPLASYSRSSSADILYISSMLVDSELVTIIAGIDDAVSCVARIPRSRIDRDWRDLSSRS